MRRRTIGKVHSVVFDSVLGESEGLTCDIIEKKTENPREKPHVISIVLGILGCT